MLNALAICLRGSNPAGCMRASNSLARQGFVAAGSFQFAHGDVETWAHPSQAIVEDFRVHENGRFACCVGPLWYRGRFGTAALALLLAEIEEKHEPDETELRGNFALFLCGRDRCVLMNDAPGFVRIYASADGAFYSTSWLAVCAYAGPVELDDAAAAEYVLLGASHSDDTVAQGITTLPLGNAFDLERRRSRPRFPAGFWAGSRVPASFDEAADEADALLRTVFGQVATAFPARVRSALSGGFDSRLILAGLLACGVHPDLFVYGNARSEDVAVARATAVSVGLPLRVVDKDVLGEDLAPPGVERLVDAALFFDGLPSDGIHDAGVDQRTRLEQMAGGFLGLNGGGGEIFRNYFHLPDRSFRAIDIVRTFYRGFDDKVFRQTDARRAYEDRMQASIERTLGLGGAAGGQKLTREEVELVYPLFRCHYWMGVNNSVAVRYGCYMTPLVDLSLIRLACRIPLAWKNAGRLQARMIVALHSGAAGERSAYGFRFIDGPDQRARLQEWATRMRPVFARPLINAMHRRSSPQQVSSGEVERWRALLPGEWRLDRTLDLRRLPTAGAFNRALSIEVVWRELVA